MTTIREWDYDGPGLEANVDGNQVQIRQFDGWGEMKVSVSGGAQARRLAHLLEAFASKQDGLDARRDRRIAQVRKEAAR